MVARNGTNEGWHEWKYYQLKKYIVKYNIVFFSIPFNLKEIIPFHYKMRYPKGKILEWKIKQDIKEDSTFQHQPYLHQYWAEYRI